VADAAVAMIAVAEVRAEEAASAVEKVAVRAAARHQASGTALALR